MRVIGKRPAMATQIENIQKMRHPPGYFKIERMIGHVADLTEVANGLKLRMSENLNLLSQKDQLRLLKNQER